MGMDFTHTHYCEREGILVSCNDKYCKADFIMAACFSCQDEDMVYDDDYDDGLTYPDPIIEEA